MSDVAPPRERVTDAGASVLQKISFGEIAGWRDDDHAAAFAAFLVGASLIADAPPKTRALGIDGRGLQRVARAALALSGEPGDDEARKFFERWFVPHRIGARGFVTGYYEPEVEASREATPRFSVPLYRRPSDLVDVDDSNRPPGWDPEMRFARSTADGFLPFFDRAAIEEGALAGHRLELAFVESPVDAFFIHVQGSARLKLVEGPERGKTLRVAYDGKAGHPYTSIGKLAVEHGILARENADKDGLEAWLRNHPHEGRALMRANRSFIFFREAGLSDSDGPLGAAGVSLTSHRSLAVDRTLHTFHTPIFVEAPELPDPEREGKAFSRLMIAQDTGSAIVGPARGDLFFGAGKAAGSRAGRVRHAAMMVALVPGDGAGGE
jgi:membrane-bound lytic murein transglycosylase A